MGQSGSGRTAFTFPPGFFWGAATAAHQVEGNNSNSDWWEYETSGRLPHRSGDACRHYQLYESDFDLARSWGHNAQRLSVEWSRIEPHEGVWDDAALDHYEQVIAALRMRGMEPFITLHHFTAPAWFLRRGGWTRTDSVARFEKFTERVALRLAGSVRFWLTINEPTVYVKRSYITGDWPPCRRNAWRDAICVLRNMARAHKAAYAVLHRHRGDAMVGMAYSAPAVVPCDRHRWSDRLAASSREYVLNRAWFDLLGRRPAKVLDFIGLNYYTRQVVSWRPSLSPRALLFGTECHRDHHHGPRTFNSLGWEIHAPGLRRVLRRFSRFGIPIVITENGISTADEQLRKRFLLDHVRELALAMEEGANVLGYFYWSLMDNFEWAEGFGARFGLAALDFATQRRLPTPAAAAYARIASRNRIEPEEGE
jgi:beta-glucosidase